MVLFHLENNSEYRISAHFSQRRPLKVPKGTDIYIPEIPKIVFHELRKDLSMPSPQMNYDTVQNSLSEKIWRKKSKQG